MELRQVLRSRSLREIVQALPANLAALKRIHRIGDARVERFGAAIINTISAYCAEKNADWIRLRAEVKSREAARAVRWARGILGT